MATIKTAIQVYDGMSPGLKAMNNAMGIVINSFESLQNVSSNAVDSNSIKTARDELAKAQYAFDNVEREIKEADAAQRNFNDNIRNGQVAADGLSRKIKMIAGTLISIAGIRKGISGIGDWLGLADVQNRAETQLKTVMGQRMGTVDIEAVLDITSAQQSIGVLGDEIQLMGAQQMATFLNTEDALHSLIPAMNNLAVQQKGVHATAEDMTNIGNMMGKVMQGQVGALSKVGITFSEAEEQVLKYGTELERADMLAQIITNNVGNMNEAIANTPQGQMQQMRNTWGDIKETVGNHLYPAVLNLFQTLNSNMPQVEAMMMGLAGALIVIINIMTNVLDVATTVSGFFVDNWSLIAPIIFGIAGALAVYHGAALLGAAATGILNAAKMLAVPIYAALTKATMANTAAQWGLNAALYANPIVWVIILVVALIAVFYAAVAAVNKFAGTSLSATGIIMGTFATAGAFIYNTFVVPLWNGFAALANFFANVFNDPVASVKILFLDMVKTVIGYVMNMASALEKVINKIPGVTVDMTSGLDNIYNKIESASQKVKDESEWVEVVGRLDYMEYDKAFQTGYNAGENLESKLNLNSILGDASSTLDAYEFGDASSTLDAYEFGNHLDGIYNGVDDTALNTASMKDSMQATEEELKYLRDIAEKEVVNRFTTAEIKVEAPVSATISSNMDLDGVVAHLEEKLYETMQVAAEGVHG